MFWGYGHSLMQQVIYIERVNPSMGLLPVYCFCSTNREVSQFCMSMCKI